LKELLRLLREALPDFIGNLAAAAVVAVFGAVLAALGVRFAGVGIWVAVLVGIAVFGTLGCAYVAFKRTPSLVEGGKGTWQYPRQRRWALASLVIIPLLTASGVGYHLYQQAQPATKAIILVANFDGPDPQKYRVTETVLSRLHAALEPYDDVQLEALGRVITEAEGSAAARAEGERRKATIVIWGWYGTTDPMPLSVHFEMLHPPKYMPELGLEARGQVRTMTVARLESFALQTRLSAEMTYLTLFTVGMTRYAVEDWEAAIALFGDALSHSQERVSALNQGIVYFYRGNASYHKGDYGRAIADYDQAIQLKPDFAEAYYNRGNAYANKGDHNRAIADYDQAIQLRPDFAEAHYNRGNASYYKGDYDRAITDFNQAIQLKPDFAEAYYNRGLAYADKGDYDRAIADYDRAIQLKPDFAKAYYNRGNAYRNMGEKEKATADFERVLGLSDNPNLQKQAEEQLKALEAR
jgi:tetratricopeptide (TPR) repeat protein